MSLVIAQSVKLGLKPRTRWSVTVSFCQFTDWQLLISCIFGNSWTLYFGGNFCYYYYYQYYCQKHMKLDAFSHWIGRNWQWVISVYAALGISFRVSSCQKFYPRGFVVSQNFSVADSSPFDFFAAGTLEGIISQLTSCCAVEILVTRRLQCGRNGIVWKIFQSP